MTTDCRSTLSGPFRDMRCLIEPEVLADALPSSVPLAKQVILAEIRLALDEGDGFAVQATAPRVIPRETLDAIEASTRRALTRAGLPVRPRTSDNGPKVWLSFAAQPAGGIRITRTRLAVEFIAFRISFEPKMVMVAARPYALERLALCGQTEVTRQLTRDARKLVNQFIKELNSQADPIRPDQP